MILKIYRVLGVDLKKWRDDAFSRLPPLEKPRILDVAVGTGVNIPYLVDTRTMPKSSELTTHLRCLQGLEGGCVRTTGEIYESS